VTRSSWWPLTNLYVPAVRPERRNAVVGDRHGEHRELPDQPGERRTFGVVGVWHRDGGVQPALAPRLAPGWTPAQGNWAAWMGLRAAGDLAHLDPITNNPFNEDVMQFTSFGAISLSGNDQGFPGYGSQMDQMLYRDIDLSEHAGEDLTLRFQFRTVMSTGANTIASTRTGWFDSDPLGAMSVYTTNPQLGNFISSTDAGDALAPHRSWDAASRRHGWRPRTSARASGAPVRQRRWFMEVRTVTERQSVEPGAAPTRSAVGDG
jgi:hypothetical protein